MVKKSVCLLVMIFLLVGCGGGIDSGGPGSSGTGDTNLYVAVDMMPSQWGIGYEMDQEKCQLTQISGSPDYNVNLNNPNNHVATLFIKASIINPLKRDTTPLYVEKYTIDYRPSFDSIGAPPIAQAVYRNASFTIMPPSLDKPDALNCRMVFPAPYVIFFDSIRKVQYLSDVRSGKYSYLSSNYLNRYTATLTFTGKNADGKEFSFIVQSDFQIGVF